MKDWNYERLCFADVETTGTSPLDWLLEVAVIVTDGELNELARGSWVVRRDYDRLLDMIYRPDRPREVNDLVWAMHTTNGLLLDCHSSPRALEIPDLDARAADLIKSTGYDPEKHGRIVLAGCSPWLDRFMIRGNLPQVARLIHHRMLDVSTLKAVLVNWSGLNLDRRGGTEAEHRALRDCEDALSLARDCRRFFIRHALDVLEPAAA